MTTWSVVKDDSQEISHRRRYFRYAVFSLTALLVLSLGIALIPRQPAPPAEPQFSEQARAAAFADAMSLRSAGLGLTDPAAGAGKAPTSASLDRVVTLLTLQARALMLPGDPAASGPSAGPTPGTTSRTAPGPTGGSSAPASASPLPSTAAGLAVALSASSVQRLKDSETADGGMARLLAGAGTAQFLAAQDLAAAAGVPAEVLPAPAPDPGPATDHADDPSGTGRPEDTPAPSAASAAPPCTAIPSAFPSADIAEETNRATLASALSSAVEAELEAVYGYQAALTRLDPASVVPASHLLEQHKELADGAAAQSRMHCAAVPPQQPGYALSQAFLDAPAAGLGRLEAGTLAVYGDVVALSAGSTRSWAVSALVAAAGRTRHWGADPGPLPGVPLDESELPQLPGFPEE
ncbi:ferritin-like domain-containing protein [Arthrobacter sp. ISL-48]|uniref:ferritin-like domain-containing protein n=1 Tax=Arthrobacter sp. ISL-48 TaxID=2819110 RepID=UPI00288C0784|nr:ferritin-like domain-containing protein [Arthrobacter sp. ISL-48]